MAYIIEVSYAERQWLVGNVTKDATSKEYRALVLGAYLVMPRSAEAGHFFPLGLSEQDLWLLDSLIIADRPFTTKLADGQLLASFGEKVWTHLARLRAPPLFRPKEVDDARDSSPNTHDDTDKSEHAPLRGS